MALTKSMFQFKVPCSNCFACYIINYQTTSFEKRNCKFHTPVRNNLFHILGIIRMFIVKFTTTYLVVDRKTYREIYFPSKTLLTEQFPDYIGYYKTQGYRYYFQNIFFPLFLFFPSPRVTLKTISCTGFSILFAFAIPLILKVRQSRISRKDSQEASHLLYVRRQRVAIQGPGVIWISSPRRILISFDVYFSINIISCNGGICASI